MLLKVVSVITEYLNLITIFSFFKDKTINVVGLFIWNFLLKEKYMIIELNKVHSNMFLILKTFSWGLNQRATR